jgi:hypothetical protein
MECYCIGLYDRLKMQTVRGCCGLATWMAWPSYFFLQVRPGIDVKGQKPDLDLEEPPQRKNGPWLFWGVVS